jgi:starch phosphorylase
MKVLVNGGINLSELDGWWAEAYTPQVGWALGDGKEHGDDPGWDAAEAASLYELLELEVIPEFYARDENGVSIAWVSKMRESMAQLTPRFSASRAVRDYTEQHYIPLAASYRLRAADGGLIGRQIVDWRHSLDRQWDELRFGELSIRTNNDVHEFEVQAFLNGINASDLRLELYAEGSPDRPAVRQELKRLRQSPDSKGAYIYSGTVPADRPVADYTPRAMPQRTGVAVPLEEARILWER